MIDRKIESDRFENERGRSGLVSESLKSRISKSYFMC